MPTQKQIRSFIQVAETGSFYQAAEKLYITSTALLQQINLLEDEIGFKVFERSRKGVALTEAGQFFLTEMKSIDNRMSYAIEQGREIAARTPVPIKMGYVFWHSSKIALELNQMIFTEYPNISVALISTELNAAISQVSTGKLDCCVMPTSTLLRESGLRYKLIRAVPLYVGMSPDLKLSGKSRIDLEDLAGQKLILPQKGLFDSTDQVREELDERKIPVEYLECNDHLKAEMACIQEQACRISASPEIGSQLKYVPLDDQIRYMFALTYHPDRAARLRPVLRLLEKKQDCQEKRNEGSCEIL